LGAVESLEPEHAASIKDTTSGATAAVLRKRTERIQTPEGLSRAAALKGRRHWRRFSIDFTRIWGGLMGISAHQLPNG